MTAPGEKAADGTVYVGDDPVTGQAVYTAPSDLSISMAWQDAVAQILNMRAGGHGDWRLPTDSEMELMYKNRDQGSLKGTFNEKATYLTAHWDLERPYMRECKEFSTGATVYRYKESAVTVRPVRTGPTPH